MMHVTLSYKHEYLPNYIARCEHLKLCVPVPFVPSYILYQSTSLWITQCQSTMYNTQSAEQMYSKTLAFPWGCTHDIQHPYKDRVCMLVSRGQTAFFHFSLGWRKKGLVWFTVATRLRCGC